MAQKRDDFGTFLFGTKGQMQEQYDFALERYNQMLANPEQYGGQEVQAAQDELSRLRGALQRELTKQGVLDEGGVAIGAEDIQERYLDKEYLDTVREQQERARDTAFSQTYSELGRQRLRGETGGSIGDIFAAVEGSQQAAGDVLTQAVKSERERAYTKGVGELNRKLGIAKSLTSDERQAVLSELQIALQNFAQEMNIGRQQLDIASQNLANSSDGFLTNLLGVIVDVGMGVAFNALTGGGAGVAGAVIGGLGGKVTQSTFASGGAGGLGSTAGTGGGSFG